MQSFNKCVTDKRDFEAYFMLRVQILNKAEKCTRKKNVTRLEGLRLVNRLLKSGSGDFRS